MSKKVLLLVGDFMEGMEAYFAMHALQMHGHEAVAVCPGVPAGGSVATAVHDFEAEQTYSEKRGHRFPVHVHGLAREYGGGWCGSGWGAHIRVKHTTASYTHAVTCGKTNHGHTSCSSTFQGSTSLGLSATHHALLQWTGMRCR